MKHVYAHKNSKKQLLEDSEIMSIGSWLFSQLNNQKWLHELKNNNNSLYQSSLCFTYGYRQLHFNSFILFAKMGDNKLFFSMFHKPLRKTWEQAENFCSWYIQITSYLAGFKFHIYNCFLKNQMLWNVFWSK